MVLRAVRLQPLITLFMTIEFFINSILIALFFLSASFLGATIAIRLDRWQQKQRDVEVITKVFEEAFPLPKE